MRFRTLAWRGLTARPLRTALTITGVALGVAVVAATLIASQAATESVERAARELLGRADVRVRAFAELGFTPRTVQSLRSLDGVLAAAPVSERRLVVTTAPGGNEQVFNLLVIGVDPTAEQAVRNRNLTAGEPLAQDRPSDVLVGARWAAEHGLEIGDELLLTGRLPDTPPLRIAGLLDEVGFGAQSQGAVLVVSRLALDTAFSAPAPVAYVDVDLADGRETELLRTINASMSEPFVIETPSDAAVQLGRAQASFAAIGFLFGLVALVVGAFLVGNTLAMTLSERTREIGLLRAAGTTRRQILELFVRQGAAIGIIGGLLGLALGIGLAAAMIGVLRSSRALLIGGLPLNPAALLLAFLLGVLLTLVGAAIPAMRAAGVSPLDALRPSRQPDRMLRDRLRWLVGLEVAVVAAGLLLYPIERGEVPIIPLILSLALLVGGAVGAAFVLEPLGRLVGRPFEWFFGAEGMLGRANLGRDRTRTGLTVGALMIALAAVVALGAVAESARATADRWVGSILPGGHAIRLGVAVDVERLRSTVEGTQGLQAASPIMQFPAVIREGDAQLETSLAGIDPSLFQDAGSLLLVEGSRPAAFQALRNGSGVLIPEELARRAGLGVGSQLFLAVPGIEPTPFAVAGVIAYSLPGRTPDGALLISLADARDVFGATHASLWAMVPQPEVPASAFEAAVRDTARSMGGEALTARGLASELGRSLDRLIGLFDALALVAVVVAALGIVNTLSVGVRERVREIAILRANGMTTGQVQAMVVTEAAIMGAVGGIVAVAIGLAVAFAMVGAGAGGEVGAGLALPWPLLATVILIGTGVAALAGIYPARVAAELPIVRSIAHFE